MEVKTFILRRLPLLVYDSEPRQKPSARHNPDPTVTNLYFDDSSFTSYMSKLERATIFQPQEIQPLESLQCSRGHHEVPRL